mmetsp:Transcript_105726/g.340875  ORF Transcript_105726/g.340875 Transcript_105726/m.340875 type:complete len:82 (-) Transcript_105726:331-576(-)
MRSSMNCTDRLRILAIESGKCPQVHRQIRCARLCYTRAKLAGTRIEQLMEILAKTFQTDYTVHELGQYMQRQAATPDEPRS